MPVIGSSPTGSVNLFPNW